VPTVISPFIAKKSIIKKYEKGVRKPMGFTQKEKRQHYNDVAKKKKPVKNPSKFEPQRQIDYARGQADSRNEAAAIYKYHNSTPEQREGYKQRQTIARQAALTGKCKVCGKPCAEKYERCYDCFKAGKTVPAPAPVVKPEKKTAKKSPNG